MRLNCFELDHRWTNNFYQTVVMDFETAACNEMKSMFPLAIYRHIFMYIIWMLLSLKCNTQSFGLVCQYRQYGKLKKLGCIAELSYQMTFQF